MKKITFTDEHRRKHFDFFRAMDQPHFGITAEVDVTAFRELIRKSATLKFTPALVYLLTRAALEVEAFTWRIRGEEVVSHDGLKPSYAVPTKHSSVFSFCTVPYDPDPAIFLQRAAAITERMQEDPSFEDEPGADDYLFMSSFPWVSFTSVTHAMHHTPGDSVPRIAWGKYFRRGEQSLMPLAVQAHHALVDGSDLGRYYQLVERYLRDCEKIFEDLAE